MAVLSWANESFWNLWATAQAYLQATVTFLAEGINTVKKKAEPQEDESANDHPAENAYSNAQELTTEEWAKVMDTNRLLHGFQIRSEVPDVIRARLAAFTLKASDDADSSPPVDVSVLKPCFQVVDGSNIQIHETTNSFQRSLAQNGFNKKSIDAELSVGDMGIQGGLSGGRGHESSVQNGKDSQEEGKQYYASYNFPRVRIFLDEYQLNLTKACKDHLAEILKRPRSQSLREFDTKYGHVFVTSVLLGGQQSTVKSAEAMDSGNSEQKQDAVRGALGAKIMAPYVSGSFQYSKSRGTGSSQERKEHAELSYVSMYANGGETLIGADVPEWSKTVAESRNWRVISNETVETLANLLATMTGKEAIPGVFIWIRTGFPAKPDLSKLPQNQRQAFRKWKTDFDKKENGKSQ